MQCVELGDNGSTAPRLEVLREERGPVLSEVLSLRIEGKLLELHCRHRAGTLQDIGRDVDDCLCHVRSLPLIASGSLYSEYG